MRGSASGRLGGEQQQAKGGAVSRHQMSPGDAKDNISVQKQREGHRKGKRAAAKERNQDRFRVEGRGQLCPHWQVLQHPGIQEEQQDGAEEVRQLGTT